MGAAFFHLSGSSFLFFISFYFLSFFFFFNVANFLKSLLNLLQYVLFLHFWFFGSELCGILAPHPGIKSTPPTLEHQVLTTGLPGKSFDHLV